MKEVRGVVFAGSSPPFLGRERAAVDVDPERRSPRYHETCLALESVKESSAAVMMLGQFQFQFQFILLSTNKIISPKAAVVAKQATTNLCGELSLK